MPKNLPQSHDNDEEADNRAHNLETAHWHLSDAPKISGALITAKGEGYGSFGLAPPGTGGELPLLSKLFRGKFEAMRIALAILLLVSVSARALEAAPPRVCSQRWGKPGAPLVASQKTAMAIFIAVEREVFPQANRVEYPDVRAKDDGAYWDVWRSRDPRRDPERKGTVVLSFAGGQLSMRINKCDAAISQVSFTR